VIAKLKRIAPVALVILLLIAVLPFAATAQEGESARTGFRPDAPPYGIRGPHPVGVQSFVVEDEERPLPGMVWYPALNPEGVEEAITYDWGLGEGVPPALNTSEGRAILDAAPDLENGPYPLVISSHGGGGTYMITAYLHEHLASYGFVVMAFYHTGNTIGDSMAAQTEEQQIADFERAIDALVHRPRDVSRVIDFAETEMANENLAGLVDTDRIAVIGISYGGYTALAAAGARLHISALEDFCAAGTYTTNLVTGLCRRHGDSLANREDQLIALAGFDAQAGGLMPSLGDERVDTIVAISPLADAFGQDGLASVQLPTLLLDGTHDPMTIPAFNAELVWANISSPERARVTFENGGHVFAGDCTPAWQHVAWGLCSDPTWDLHRSFDLTDHFVTAFLLTELYGDQEAAAALAPDAVAFPGVRYETTFGN
jgi:predicted dienelactone hydrolase